MSPKEKACQLVTKFLPHTDIAGESCFANEAKNINKKEAKSVALIAVDEIISVCPYVSKGSSDTVEQLRAYDTQFIDYWLKVKAEIEKL